MERNQKLVIGIIIVILLFVISIRMKQKEKQEEVVKDISSGMETSEEYVKTTMDGTKVNTSEKLAEKKVVNDIEFSGIQLTENSGETVLIATVKNIGSKKSEMFAVDITLIDKDGKEIETIPGLIAPMEVGATSQFSTSTTLNYVNAYDFKVVAK